GSSYPRSCRPQARVHSNLMPLTPSHQDLQVRRVGMVPFPVELRRPGSRSMKRGAGTRDRPTDRPSQRKPGSSQLFEQGPGLFLVEGVPSLGEPAERLGQQTTSLDRLATLPQQACQAQRGPQLERLRALTAGDVEGPAEAGLRLEQAGRIGLRELCGG